MNNNQKLSSYEKLDFSTHVIMFLTIMGMVFWFHSEARQDWKHMDSKIEVYMKGIQEEMKDFHGRLCAIEERNKGK